MARLVAVETAPDLAQLLAVVEAGETVTVTRAGRPVAELRAEAALSAAEREGLARMRALRQGLVLGDLDASAAIDEGRP